MSNMEGPPIKQIYGSIANLISVLGDWTATVTEDGVGACINIISPEPGSSVRSLALSEGEPGTHRYWQFWNSDGLWLDTDLNEHTDVEEILSFLKDSLREEVLLQVEAAHSFR